MLRGIAGAGVGLSGEPMATPFQAGARPSAWVGNCVALGEAAVRLEPLDAAPLQLLQIGLTHLIALFPVEAEHMPEADIYNAAIASHARNIRDFQIAHYKLNNRLGEPFWDRARAMAVPESLAYKLEVFGQRGRVPLYDDETFQEPNWTLSFVGHGLTPQNYDPLVNRLSEADQTAKINKLLGFIRHHVDQMPSVEAQIEISAPMSGSGLF
jgi:tryptophan halogenase